jgi:hypothetical protein
MKPDRAYFHRPVATNGCEILTATGRVVGWAIDEYWAITIVRALNNPPSPCGDGGLLPSKDWIRGVGQSPTTSVSEVRCVTNFPYGLFS